MFRTATKGLKMSDNSTSLEMTASNQDASVSACHTGPSSTYSLLDEVQGLLVKLDNLRSMLANASGVAVMPTVISDERFITIRSNQYNLPLRELRNSRMWTQAEVVERLRLIADRPLPSDLINCYKRWERGRHSPSTYYARLLQAVFAVDNVTVSECAA